jgi:plasmid stabilization system protein ParE
MAAKPVRFHPEADEEYLSSLAWYSERSPTAALDFESEFQRAISAVAEAPERWPAYLSRCRRYVLHQFPFSIVYRILDKEVVVLAVAHGHRRPGYWRKRLRH